MLMVRRGASDITLVERAYDLAAGDDAWLDGIHDAASPIVDRGFGVLVGTWQMQGTTFTELGDQRGSAPEGVRRVLRGLVGQLPREVLAKNYGPHATDFIGSTEEIWPDAQQLLVEATEAEGVVGVRDLFGLLVLGNPGRNGMVLTAAAPTRVKLAPRDRVRLKRLATHLSAGLRLRLTLAAQQPPDAVLTPDGQLVHAERAARTPSARAALVAAVRAIETSRGKLRRTSPEEALALWKGLVTGQWSLVDRIESDRRRYLVAYENPISARSPRALTRREVDVAECLIQGRSASEVAYALGLSTGTVSRMTRDILRKLGVQRRTELASIFGSIPPLRASISQEPKVSVLTPGSNAALWERLRPAERAVVTAVLEGRTPGEIARTRGVSVKTVSNQLGHVYQRFGVRGRTELATLLGAP
jgi:DNA-binding NarL/FixJ family response regulator